MLSGILRKGNVSLETMKSVDLLHIVSSPLCQCMLNNFLTDEKKTSDNRDLVLQKDVENAIDGTCELRGLLKENKNKKNT